MGTHRIAGTVLFFLLTSSVALPAPDDEWVDLKARYEEAFAPLPIKKMFGDPDKELKISRRAPYTAAARAEIRKRRDQLALLRAQIVDERKKREGVAVAIGDFGGARAAQFLMDAYERQLGEVAKAKKNHDLYEKAAGIDINPGVDPGGVYWERWLGGERGAARSVLADERKIRNLILAQCAKIQTPAILQWVADSAAGHEDLEVRERMMSFLAISGEAPDAAALGGVFRAETHVWARVAILDHVAKGKSSEFAPLVRDALGDGAWPVRVAAVAAVRALGLRDAETIDALIAAMAGSDGRVMYEIRNALSEATGEALGLLAGEWKIWWGVHREGWSPPAAPSKVAPLPDPLPVVYGVPTASKRIAILIPRSSGMRNPTKRRAKDNAGNSSPLPGVDSALRVAVWELEQALGELPQDVEFVVMMYGVKVGASSKKLVTVTKSNVKKALAVASKYPPEGGANTRAAVEAALRLGVKGKVADLARAGVGDVDTVFLVGIGRQKWLAEYVRLRRVRFHIVDLSRLTSAE